MKLHEMKSTPGSRGTKKRVGRGTGSGWGKTAGRGENGQKSRSGFKNKIGFEGGQNPLYRRIPKRGFTNFNTVDYSIVNIEKLQELGLTVVTPETLIEARVIKNSYGKLKILGNGEITIAIEVTADKFSKSAIAAIEKAGGKVTVIPVKEVPAKFSSNKGKKTVKTSTVKSKATIEKSKITSEKEKSSVEKEIDFSTQTVADLKSLAKAKGIKGYSTMKKTEVIAALKAA